MTWDDDDPTPVEFAVPVREFAEREHTAKLRIRRLSRVSKVLGVVVAVGALAVGAWLLGFL